MAHDHDHNKAILHLTPEVSAEDFTRQTNGEVAGLETGEVFGDPDAKRHVSKYRTGIGRDAVLLALQEVDDAVVNDRQELDNRQSRERVDAITRNLAGLKGAERDATNSFIGSQLSNEWLYSQLGIPKDEQGSTVTDYLQYLTATDSHSNEFIVNQDTRMNFLEWYNAQLANLTTKITEQKPEIIQQFTHRFERLIERGIVPESAARNLARLDNLEIVIDDGPLTAWRGTMGTYLSNKDAEVVHLAPFALNSYLDPHNLTITHEIFHAMSGMRDMPNDADKPVSWHDRDKMYGFEKQFGWQVGTTGQRLNEAMTEYLALTSTDESETFDRLDIQDGEYRGGRQLLAVLASFGLEKIPIADFTAVHFAKSEDIDDAIERLNDKLVAAFPGATSKDGTTIITLLKELTHQSLLDSYEEQADHYTFGAIGAFCDELITANYRYANRADSNVSEAQWLAAATSYYKRDELFNEDVSNSDAGLIAA